MWTPQVMMMTSMMLVAMPPFTCMLLMQSLWLMLMVIRMGTVMDEGRVLLLVLPMQIIMIMARTEIKRMLMTDDADADDSN